MKDTSGDAYLTKRLAEIAGRANRDGSITYSRFLTPAEADDARKAASDQGVRCTCFGGYDDAERRIAAFSTEALHEMPSDTPLRWVSVHWDVRYGSVGHRDLLGALMGLGLEREIFGDIIIREAIAYFVMMEDMVDFVKSQLTSVGNVAVKVLGLPGQPDLPKQVYRMRRDTVASLRLDAVVAAAFHLSRSAAAEKITEGSCKVDHRQVLLPDYRVDQGMLLSLRGKGRVRLGEIGDVNRKGRTAITLLYNE